MNNSSGSANSFDDKNRDTFGEDFVMDHQIQQQARQQRYHYGEREQNNRRGISFPRSSPIFVIVCRKFHVISFSSVHSFLNVLFFIS